MKIPREEYQKQKNDYRVLCGCFSVIWKAFQNSYPLLNRGLLDKRKSVKRFAVLCVLVIICKVYLEKRFQELSRNGDNGKDIDVEIEELKKNIKFTVFLASLDLTRPSQFDKRLACEMAVMKEEILVKVSSSVLG